MLPIILKIRLMSMAAASWTASASPVPIPAESVATLIATHTATPAEVKLFDENAEWETVDVAAGADTATCLAMLLGTYVEIALRRTPAARPPVWLLNRAAAALDGRVASLREPRPGSLTANFHVVATVAA